MVKKVKLYLLIFVTACRFNCGKDHHEDQRTGKVSDSVFVNELRHQSKHKKNISAKPESPNTIDINDRIKRIRDNCSRINLIKNWSTVKTEELSETNEGGEAAYYYQNGRLEKITAQNFGETFQQLREYYLLDGQLCFVFEKSFQYNRPMYYDKNSMKENKDTEAFDMDKSKITESRSYFAKEKLFRRIITVKGISYHVKDSLHNEKDMMLRDFQQLLKKS